MKIWIKSISAIAALIAICFLQRLISSWQQGKKRQY